MNLGIAEVKYGGSLSPQILQGGGTISTALAGASIASLVMKPPPDASTLPLLIVNGFGILYKYESGTLSQISTSLNGSVHRAVYTPTGQILFIGYDVPTGTEQLFRCNDDGSGTVKLTNSSNLDYNSTLSVSPDGLHILFDNTGFGMYIIDSSGANETNLIRVGNHPAWAPDGKRYAFTDAFGTIWVAGLTGNANPVQISPVSAGAALPTWTPDGKAIAYWRSNGSGKQIVVTDSLGKIVSLGSTSAANTAVPVGPSFSADGRTMAFVGLTGANNQVMKSSWTGTDAQMITSDEAAVGYRSLSFAPYLRSRIFIGSGSVLLPSASGFVWSQTNNKFGSLLAFATTTASTAKITQEANAGNAVMLKLVGDQITAIRYTNGYNLPATAISLTAGTKNALVSINSVTGQIAFTATYKVLSPTRIASSAGRNVIEGDFDQVFDSKGIRQGGGVHSLSIDPKTGVLLATR